METKIKLKSTLYFDFCFVSKLIWSRNSYWNKTGTQTFYEVNYNNIILEQRAIKFWTNIFSIGSRLCDKEKNLCPITL